MIETAERPLLTTEEVARRLRVSTRTVYRLTASGRLAPVRLSESGPLRFSADDVDELIERSRRAGTPDAGAVEPGSGGEAEPAVAAGLDPGGDAGDPTTEED
jgi:excisionase family DNA binding protein